ncbi:MAG: non-ribosomal peptide synthetase-like protein [Akkermansiaceae bacterium]|jgi:non-ribosomal peptide synthetase-like protein
MVSQILRTGFEDQAEALLLHALFERQTEKTPEAVALITDERELTYRALDERANQLAHYLVEKGVKTGDLVGLYTFRSEVSVVAILGILKAGAGYVPIDPAFPEERIRHILADADISVVLSLESLQASLCECYGGKVVTINGAEETNLMSLEPTSRVEVRHDDQNLCYVIYTSGTTGKPKGVMTEHRNTVLFVHAFNEVCQVTTEDRIYHGFSLGFDGSVEEMWLAFSNGASLVVGPQETGALGNEVAACINRHRATFYSTVPTALTMITEDLETIRVLIVSGEQCPPEQIARWAVNGRRMLNVYGPTEATVNTTAAECRPNQPVTIGVPLRGYDLHLLDGEQKPVPEGESGELYVGGSTLARGYLNQPEVTAKAFMDVELGREVQRLYRTGDLVKWDEKGELLFLGRIDTQVKIRGYRIELAEIETLLLEWDRIQSAVVNVVEEAGVKELAAFVVLEDEEQTLDRSELHATLKTKLPVYMLPKFLDVICELPTLASGKVNRRELPAPKQLFRGKKVEVTNHPRSRMEVDLAAIWSDFFPGVELCTTDDFFTELGGHSMLAAQMVTKVRDVIGVDLALREVYKHPTLGEMATFLDAQDVPHAKEEPVSRSAKARPMGGLNRPSVAIIQAIGIYGIYAILTTIALGFFYIFWRALSHPTMGTTGVVAWVAAVVILGYPALVFSSVVIKWAVIGRYRPGAYPIGGSYYLRWWFVTRYQALAGTGFLSGTPLLSLYFRLMGAKVGKGCVIDSALCACFDVVEIGSGSCIGNETQLLGSRVEGGYLKIGRVSIGKDCYVGIHSALGLNTSMGDGTQLDNLSLLSDGESIPAGEGWSGSPAVLAEVSVPASEDGFTPKHPILFGLLHFVQIYVMGLIGAVSFLPVLGLLYGAYLWGGWGFVAVAAVAGGPFSLVCYCLMVVVVKFVVMPRTKTGLYPVESWYYLRKWFVDTFYRTSRAVALPLYTTIYFPTWLRMLGAKIGKFAELSTVSQFAPDLMKLGERSFFADGSIIGGRRYYRGMVEIGISEVGDRSFIGNSAMLPINRPVGDDCLIGCMSLPPTEHEKTPDGTDWLGSPSFGLPHRQIVGNFDESVTYQPTAKLIFQRCLVDGMRILFPSILTFVFVLIYIAFVYFSYTQWGELATILLATGFSLLLDIVACLLVVVYKRILLGKIEPGIHPLWSMFVWKNEAVNGAYESIVAPSFVPMLGTPFLAPFLRLLGCKIGKDTYLGTTLFSEWDLVEVGDHVALNAGTVVQNHLFEDRVMKASHLKIGDRCSVGNMAVVLYDTEMKEGSELAPLSLLMKGETVPANSRWSGIPTARDTVSEEIEPELETDEVICTATYLRQRISSIDVLRGLAVLGILLMNIRSFAGPDIGFFNPPEVSSDTLWNRIAYYFTSIFADQKFMALFSILFGASLILLTRSLRERGRNVIGALSLRYFWLLLLGLVHFFLLWNGDVLAVYALCVIPLLLLFRLPAAWQFGLGLCLFLLPAIFDAGIQQSLPTLDEESRISLDGYWHPFEKDIEADKVFHLEASWMEQIQARWEGETAAGANRGEALLIASIWGNFLARSLGMMLIGMALFRWKILSAERSKVFYRRMAGIGFGVGIPLALYGLETTLFHEWKWDFALFLGRVPNHLATIPISFGYIGLIMLWVKSGHWKFLRTCLANVGRVALTCYLGQTLLCLFIFYGVGLGLYGQFDYLEQFVFVVLLSILQLFLASAWLNRFPYGPLEWVWRGLSKGFAKSTPSIES